MKSKSRLAVLVPTFLGFALPGSTLAADLAKEGKYDTTACVSGIANRLDLSKTDWAATYEHSGTIFSNPSGGIFDKSSVRCIGLRMTAQGRQSDTTVCLNRDSDGDMRMYHFAITPDGTKTRELIAATGKYEGMTETYAALPLGPFPTIKEGTYQMCNRQTGTYKLK